MLLTLGLTVNLFSADYTEIKLGSQSVENLALNKQNVRIVLDVLEDREKSTRDFSGDLAQTIEDFNMLVENDGTDSKGILMVTIPSNPLLDMRTNPQAVVIISALSHVVNFPYDPLPVPQYERVGEGKVVFGTFHLENFAKAMQIAHSVQESTPAMLDRTIEGGQFQSFADVLTTYNAFKAYLQYLQNYEPARLETDGKGNLYIADSDRIKIRTIG